MDTSESLQQLLVITDDGFDHSNLSKRTSSEKNENFTNNHWNKEISSSPLEKIFDKFQPLNIAEEKLLSQLRNGKFDRFSEYEIGTDYSHRCEDKSDFWKLNDPANADKWGDERTIRAELLACMCRDSQVQEQLPPQGLVIKGAKIDGEVNLDFAEVKVPLCFIKCVLPKSLRLYQAKLYKLSLEGTHVTFIVADQVNIEGNLELNRRFQSSGEVRLVGAKIGGKFDCEKGRFNNPSGIALLADGIDVRGSVLLTEGFCANGQVRLVGATIGRSLNCKAGKFNNPKVDENNGIALSADGISVGGSLFLTNKFDAKGEVRLARASIGNNLDCGDGAFNNPGGTALSAIGVDVKGDVFLRQGFSAEGTVNLSRASISGVLDCQKAKKVTLNLEFAKIQNLKLGEKNSWTENGKLRLNGLIYESIDIEASDIGQRQNKKPTWFKDVFHKSEPVELHWLRHQYSEKVGKSQFLPQPYEQLARVLKAHGKESEAIQVLIGKEDDRRQYDGLNWLGKRRNQFLGFAIGHGYRPERSVVAALCWVGLGWGVFHCGYSHKLMSPATDSFTSNQSESTLDQIQQIDTHPNYPKFNSLIYSLDTFLPVVDLRLESYWLPNANSPNLDRKEPILLVKSGAWVRYYLWIHILMGWILTSLIVASFSGLVRSSK